jgi:hypothetical protein
LVLLVQLALATSARLQLPAALIAGRALCKARLASGQL